MRRSWRTAVSAVPFFLLAATATGLANPPERHGFGLGDYAFKIFPHIFQEGPLFNYGPYYGYYPFAPYGPWDAYLRYDPYFYGDPYKDYALKPTPDESGRYGRNPLVHRPGFPVLALPIPSLFHKQGCTSCGFWHASWLHGGWFHGHNWLAGSHLFHKPACTSCGGVALARPAAPSGDVMARYSGFGSPTDSAVFYTATPTLDPALELLPTAGQAR